MVVIRHNDLVHMISEAINNLLYNNSNRIHLFEMATIGSQKWGKDVYSIQIHGASTSDRDIPHIHIYLKNDYNKKNFNFEVSLIDLVSKDEINLIYQLDRTKHIKYKNRNYCSWTGYSNIYDGLRDYLFGNVQLPQYQNLCRDNLDAAIYAWNIETDADKTLNGGNPMKEWLDAHNIQILPEYQQYFEQKPQSINQNQ